eukprot:11390935-Alexandrium_andersonii.AAC.1
MPKPIPPLHLELGSEARPAVMAAARASERRADFEHDRRGRPWRKIDVRKDRAQGVWNLTSRSPRLSGQ